MQEARVVLDGLENASTSHAGCNAAAKINMNPNGIYILSRAGTHSPVVVPTNAQRTGIHKPLLTEVDNLLLGGQGPKQCLGTLQSRSSLDFLSATDGTYKLRISDYTLVSFGTFGVDYGETEKYHQTFYPMAFMFVRTETAFAYNRLFKYATTTA
ncbi:hypothetical protein L915_01199 [Phytophthora nicotianae]|uniref:Uncharacterized protein n=2 Tax=Phytophthora nicotianae TaxID=4792 RepID=W2HNA7_PHYNI|nr:hypothetical protein L915_01199 [Phytophthora nicotianae]